MLKPEDKESEIRPSDFKHILPNLLTDLEVIWLK
jgi:hypothetical protein